MLVPLSWLREYVDFDLAPEALAELLTNAGLEVTAMDKIGVDGALLPWDRERVLLAQVVEVERHPDADRLVIASVDCGADAIKKVVTGAPNLFDYLGRGDLSDLELLSPLLLEGATYLDPYKDKKPTRLKGKKLRGVWNDSMLCSAVELGLGEDHEGIVLIPRRELAGEGRPGQPLVEVLGDVVLDIDIIPNIARCASMVGVAREVAALTGSALRLPSLQVDGAERGIDEYVAISTEAPHLNPRFVAYLIEGVEQKPSPFWMQHRLRLAGQRPIHVVVDISNYVMLEVGQPNHTYDYDFLRQRADRYASAGPVQLITRLAQPEETVTTLDGASHEVMANTILVTDPLGNLGIGGIMGGADSEIQPHTQNVLLEAAAWDFINIRQSSRQLGLLTDAAFRFSRGVHPSQAMVGARRAAKLMHELAAGTVTGGLDYYAAPPDRVTVQLDPSYVNQRSGLELSRDEMGALLERLEFEVTANGEALEVTVPDHRLDIEGQHDLLEEVCRMYGYGNLPSTVLADELPPQRGNRALELEERVKDLLVELGLQEVITYRLTTREAEARVLTDSESLPYVALTNPSTRERALMRRSLLVSVLEVAAANSRFRERLALFEVGRVFPLVAGDKLPPEPTRLVLVLSGPRAASSWQGTSDDRYGFFDVKGILESLYDELKVNVAFVPTSANVYRPGRVAQLEVETASERTTVGTVGELHPRLVEQFGFRLESGSPVVAAEVDLEALLASVPERFTIDPLPSFPAVREDLALLVDSEIQAADVERAILEGGGELLREVELFDVYQGEQVGGRKRSLAYHLTFQSPSKTLSDQEVAKLRRRILKRVESTVGAVLRS